MKILFLILISALSLNLAAQESKDIFIKSRFDYESSYSFIKRLRAFLINNDFGDPYNQSIKKPIVIDLNKAVMDLPASTQSWVRDLQSVLQLKLFESSYKLIINDLKFSLQNFNSELKPTVSYMNRVEYVTINHVQGLTISSSSIKFEVELKKTSSGDPIKFDVELLQPVFKIKPEMMMELPMGWLTSIMPENVLISLQSIDLQKLFDKLVTQPELIDLKIMDIKMPQVALRIGSKEIALDHEKIKTFFSKRSAEMKKGILDLINVRLHDRLGNIIADVPQELMIPRTYMISSRINAVFDIQEMSTNNSKLLNVDLDGHFCPKNEAVDSGFCWQNKIPAKIRRKIPAATYEKAVREVSRSLIENNANIGISVSEHYFNQLIAATMQAGLWDQDLEKKDFKMGPEKAFVLSEKKGTTFSLYIDIIHELKGTERVLVGRSELRFPIKFAISVNIIDLNGIPHLQIIVNSVETSEELIINGKPEYGLVSTVKDVRFRKRVIKSILEEVNDFKYNMLVDLEMKEFIGTYLEELEFTSDGLGRATAMLTLGKNKKTGKEL